MEKVKLEEEIKELLLRGHEGGYWDYKSDYADCPEDKLMDYICMANNLEGRDAYLIYGVDNDGKIIGKQKIEIFKSICHVSFCCFNQTV